MRIAKVAGALMIVLALASMPQARAADTVAQPDCQAPPKADASSIVTNAAVSVTIDAKPAVTPVVGIVDPEPAWQPRGGTVAFTVRGNGVAVTDVKVDVCFGWKGRDFKRSPHVWISDFSDKETTYNAIVPDLIGAPDGVRRTGIGIVPIADLRVIVAGGPADPSVDIVRSVGITRPGIAAFIAFVAVILALGMFYLYASERGVPGDGFVLWLISTRWGVASLSQLQIMVWTFVVGASAVYVMALSGGLIEITDGTLILLGIAGGATVTSKLQNNNQDTKPAPAPAAMPALPGAIPYLNIVGTPADTEIRLAWAPPTTGGAIKRYLVQYSLAALNPPVWSMVAETVVLPHHTVIGLSSGATYVFQLQAENAGGLGPAIQAGPFTTAAVQPPIPAAAPDQVAGLRVDLSPGVSLLSIAWSPVAAATAGYIVQFRRHDSVEPWVPRPISHATTMSISPLAPGTAYDFRVSAGNANGFGPWSSVLTCRTVRNPSWADLVVAGPGRGEVDVTRVQMLFFTLITAAFVTMTVLNTYTIPEIPQGFLILMGLSNGVYLTNKFVGDGA